MKSLASTLRSRLEASAQVQVRKPLRKGLYFAGGVTALFCFLPLAISLTWTLLYGPGTIIRYRIEDAVTAFVSMCTTSAITFGCIFVFVIFVLGIGLNSPAIRRRILLYGAVGLLADSLILVIFYYRIFTGGRLGPDVIFIFEALAYVSFVVGIVALAFAVSGWTRYFLIKRAK